MTDNLKQGTPLHDWLLEVEKKPKQRWIIKGLVPPGAYVLMSGQRKATRKTSFAQTIAIAIATGVKHQILEPMEKGKVFFVLEEGTEQEERFKILALCKALKITDLILLNNIYFFFQRGFKLDHPEMSDQLVAMVKKEEPLLVIMDPFFRMLLGNENQQEDVNLAFDCVYKIRALGTAVIVISHTNEGKGASPKAPLDQQVRGSGVIKDGYDVHLALRRYEDGPGPIDFYIKSKYSEDRQYEINWTYIADVDEDGDAFVTWMLPDINEKNGIGF